MGKFEIPETAARWPGDALRMQEPNTADSLLNESHESVTTCKIVPSKVVILDYAARAERKDL